MQQRISKKIIIYLSLFFIFTTINNNFLDKLSFPKINFIKIDGLDFDDSQSLQMNLDYLKLKNLFFLDENKIKEKINSNKIVDKFSVFKNYPSTLEIKIKKTQFLAGTKKNGIYYFIGSNGKLIQSKNNIFNLPFIFGNFKNHEFIEFKNIVDNSNFNFKNIKNLYFYPSKRWDIETIDGYVIKLPKHDLYEKLNFYIHLIKDQKFKNLKFIDLRQKNQVIINEE